MKRKAREVGSVAFRGGFNSVQAKDRLPDLGSIYVLVLRVVLMYALGDFSSSIHAPAREATVRLIRPSSAKLRNSKSANLPAISWELAVRTFALCLSVLYRRKAAAQASGQTVCPVPKLQTAPRYFTMKDRRQTGGAGSARNEAPERSLHHDPDGPVCGLAA